MARDREFPFHQIAGGFIALMGLWHMWAPWLMGYAELTPLKTSALVAGAGLAVFGALGATTRLVWPTWACGAIALWVLCAPGLLGYGTRGVALDEAMWTGLTTLAVVALLGLEVRFGAPARPAGPSRA